MLTTALGVLGVVRKQRRLLWCGQTRIHLDEVEGLGNFLELEVVLRENEDQAMGVTKATDLMNSLEIQKQDLVSPAYIDLLLARDSVR